MRKLEWRDEKAFSGWACSSCGWIYPNPSLEDAAKEHHQLVQQKFDEHQCDKHPTHPRNDRAGIHSSTSRRLRPPTNK
jgi:hypothetical protein